jgi:anti-sigma factor RsiW
MTPLACAAALRQLQAYHDDELPVPDQIAVSAHLDRCGSCRETLADLESVGNWLRASAPGRASMSCHEAEGFASAVVNRARVEDEASLLSWVRELFDDRRVVYSALGATSATLACLVVMLTMMRFAGIERTDSLAGMMNVLKAPAAIEQPVIIRPVVIDARVIMPRALDSFSDTEVGDSVLALSGVVTSEGRVANIEVNDGNGGVAMASMDAKRLENLVDAVSKTRFEPMMKEGAPVAVNMVWFVAHTTVRGVGRHHLDGPQLRGARKRVV